MLYICQALLILLFLATAVAAQTGTISGTVRLGDSDKPVHNVLIVVSELNRSVETDDEGRYEIQNVPAGKYSLIAHLDKFPDIRKEVTVTTGTVNVDFEMRLISQDPITITVTGREQAAFESFQAVTVLDSLKLTLNSQPSFGESLGNRIGDGISKRSFGPGAARPVIRGFDGDRVLVLQDGLRVGSIGSQSGDHGEPIDVLSLDKLEVVKGPATLLYGSNAVGGVVNAITGHHELHDQPHSGLRGYLSGLGGSTNGLGGGSAGIEYGVDKFLVWGGGGGQRTGDYDTPEGKIPNSKSRTSSGRAGFGYYGDRGYFSLGYNYNNLRYGVPFAAEFEGGEEEELRGHLGKRIVSALDSEEEELIDLAARTHNLRLSGGFRDVGALDAIRYALNYNDYQHQEVESGTVNTTFRNKEFSYRAYFDQPKAGQLTGTFGFSGLARSYKVDGAEALAPPVDHNNFAAFLLEELKLKNGVKFQFGGRVETNRYNAEGLRDRSFTGFSGAAGISVPVFERAVVVANYTHSYRAPALEELYNNGPHIGTLTFEVGNVDLKRERTDGLDFAFRYSGERVRTEASFYYYNIRDFVFLAPTGEIEDGLPVADYTQADSRFIGMELGAEVKLRNYLSLTAGLDAVDAELKQTDSPLPRIPPLRGRVGLDFNYKGFSLAPEALMVRSQNQVFSTETRTAGYTVFNLNASYTFFQQHAAHIFSVSGFNLGDRLYRNHLSFIKDRAAEIGRGVRFTYTVKFF